MQIVTIRIYPMVDFPGNMKMTRQRRVILDTLSAARIHPTADELFIMVRDKLPEISLATVYRNLDSLAKAGVVRKLELAGGQMRFDGTTEDHLHVSCIKCGKISDLPPDSAAGLINKAAKATEFTIIDFIIEFRGICPDCFGEDEHP